MREAAAAPSGRDTGRIALIRARTGVDIRYALLLTIAVVVYGYFASRAELLGQSPTAVALLTVLAWLTGAGFLLRPTADRLDMFRVFSFYFLIVFCIGPIFEPALSFYVFDEPKSALLTRSAALAFFAYASMAAGYHLPLFRRAPKVVLTRHEAYDPRICAAIGLTLFFIGAVSFIAMFMLAGGAAVILRGEGALARSEFSFGLGWYYWASLFMVPGGAIFYASRAHKRHPLAWLQAWPLFSAFVLLTLLQGRHRAMGPILVMLAISHYLLHRIRLPRLALYALLGMAFAVIMNTARSPGLRGTFTADPIGFSAAVLENFPEEVRSEMAGGIGRIDEVMIVVDHVPDRMPYDWGHSLTIPLNPILRQIGRPDLQARMVGERLYVISRPDTWNSPYRTGFTPSIVGEMRANFPTLLCFFPYLVYGLLLRVVYQMLIIRSASFLAVAAYCILLFNLCNMLIGTFAQSTFEIVVVTMPVLLCHLVARRRSRRLSPAVAQPG